MDNSFDENEILVDGWLGLLTRQLLATSVYCEEYSNSYFHANYESSHHFLIKS